MKTKNTTGRLGFTLVELLIAIVVIALLAAISVVAYNGITQRAHNSQMVAAAKTYQQALVQYSTVHDEHPTTVEYHYGVCLGDGYEGGHCWKGPSGDYRVRPEFDALLSEFVGSKPTVPVKFYHETATDSRSGIVYYRNNPSGRQTIDYLLDGRDKPCALAGAVGSNVANGTATRCRISLPLL